ncbi:MAG TPA: hypothetical protein VJ831_00300, partial [Jatrophihabitantaceae bacterium]|nr:hypothetical protein [Jatrophihabitantaceae bacterium]
MTSWPLRWWARQSLRARLTLLATALFSFAVLTGAVLLLVLQRYALVRTLDNSAEKSAKDTAAIYKSGKSPATVLPTTGGVIAMQVVDAEDRVIAVCCGADRVLSLLTPDQLQHARNGRRYNINNPTSNSRQRVVAEPADDKTVLVVTDLK